MLTFERSENPGISEYIILQDGEPVGRIFYEGWKIELKGVVDSSSHESLNSAQAAAVFAAYFMKSKV